MTKLFLIGPTTPMGDELLHQLLSNPAFQDIEIETHHLDLSYCKQLEKLSNNRIKCHKVSLKDNFFAFDMFQNNDIVINCDPESTQKFAGEFLNYASFYQNFNSLVFINTSNKSIITDTDNKGNIQRSFTNLKELTNLQYSEPRPRDESEIRADEAASAESKKIEDYEYKILRVQNPNIKTLMITQPSILGTNHKYHLTKQLTRESMDIKHFVQLNDQLQSNLHFTTQSPQVSNYNWSHVNLKSISSIYTCLLENLLNQNSIKTGKHGVYFNENGLNYWKEPYSDKIRPLTSQGIDMSCNKINFGDLDSDSNNKFNPVIYNDSQIKMDMDYKMGWKQSFTNDLLCNEDDQLRAGLDVTLEIM